MSYTLTQTHKPGVKHIILTQRYTNTVTDTDILLHKETGRHTISYTLTLKEFNTEYLFMVHIWMPGSSYTMSSAMAALASLPS